MATDIGKHMHDLKEMQGLIEDFGLAKGGNFDEFLEADTLFNSQQKLIDLTVHSSDIS